MFSLRQSPAISFSPAALDRRAGLLIYATHGYFSSKKTPNPLTLKLRKIAKEGENREEKATTEEENVFFPLC